MLNRVFAVTENFCQSMFFAEASRVSFGVLRIAQPDRQV